VVNRAPQFNSNRSINASSEGLSLPRKLAKVAPSASARTRSGDRNASSCATIPPIEMPNTFAADTASASSTASASPASCAIEQVPRVGPENPVPR